MLRCLGNVICSGLDETAAAACEKKALFPALGRLLASEHQHVRKECLWVLSNVTGIICLIECLVSFICDTSIFTHTSCGGWMLSCLCWAYDLVISYELLARICLALLTHGCLVRLLDHYNIVPSLLPATSIV